MKSFSGCWTCRVRRKKCDEVYPVCHSCATLHITCHYNDEKPEWMDGGAKQEEMAKQLKRQVKDNSHQRRADRASRVSEHPESTTDEPSEALAPSSSHLSKTTSNHCENGVNSVSINQAQHDSGHVSTCKIARTGIDFGWPDTILTTFYLEHVFPFLFPFYSLSPCQGGKAWILELMIRSPVVRQATLCQSSYFLSLVQDTAGNNASWENTLTQTKDAFEILRKALQVIYDSDIKAHLHGAVRIMTSIMQVLRFEIAISSFSNCQLHLGAALTLFKQLLGSVDGEGSAEIFDTVMSRLKSSLEIWGTQYSKFPSAEQNAFRFSSALLVLHDIINSMLVPEQPKLHEYHRILLGNPGGSHPAIDLEAITGCQNWVFIHMSEIIVLDVWKKECKSAGNLDVIELVRRATQIKESLEAYLASEGLASEMFRQRHCNVLFMLTEPSQTTRSHCASTTRVWAHAALLYLTVVVSEWQIANNDVCHHVRAILQLLTSQISPPEMLRTVVWPFCVAGCLAEPAQEVHFRALAEALHPPSMFGTVREALVIMESVWRNRNAIDSAKQDIAACFRRRGELILLV